MSTGHDTTQTRAGANSAPARGRGRPRSEQAHRAILDATLTLLDEGGYGPLTIEAVAARAGVGKTTIYRRWPSKLELVIEAVGEMRPPLPTEDTGSVQGDFLAFQRNQINRVAAGPLPRVAPRLIAESVGDAELQAVVQRELIAPVRQAIGEVLQRGVDRGELLADLDVELATDIVHGTVVYRILTSQGDLLGAVSAIPRVLDLLRVD
ncbi:MAG TPA: TetR/AcrR family transcriptional regulator [Thermoleophilaceae bacterium]|nr:TetR/AcrR family transcriptional regulator [Thermoleophilaceae bacterium]